MAGEIQLNSTTMATESSGSITAELDTIRPNTSNGSLTLQGDSSDVGVTGLTIDSNGNATFAQTISGGTIGNGVTLTDSYYLQAKLDTSFTSSLPTNINFDGATSPYWVFTSDSDWNVSGTGSNFSKGTTNADLKIHRAGVYLVNFSVTAYETNPDVERALDIIIRGVGSASSSDLARSIDQIATTGESGGNYGSGSVSLIYKFNANDQINFYISSASGGSANVYAETHFNICLLRPL